MATYPQMSYSPSQQWQYPPSAGPGPTTSGQPGPSSQVGVGVPSMGAGAGGSVSSQGSASSQPGAHPSRIGQYPLMSTMSATGAAAPGNSSTIYSQPRFDAFNTANPNLDLTSSMTSPSNINYYRYQPRSPIDNFYSTASASSVYPSMGGAGGVLNASPTDETFTANPGATTFGGPTAHHGPRGRSGSTTVYEFVSLAGSQQQKRPRRKYEEIERIYNCNYPGCTKAYGTLNHLNAHVSMQKHGAKRTPEEFKETRRLWKLRKSQQQQQQQQEQRLHQNHPSSTTSNGDSKHESQTVSTKTDPGLATSPNVGTTSSGSNSRNNSTEDLTSSSIQMPLYNDITLGYSQSSQNQFDSASSPFYSN